MSNVYTGKIDKKGVSVQEPMEASLSVSMGYADSETTNYASKKGAIVVAVPGGPDSGGFFKEDRTIGNSGAHMLAVDDGLRSYGDSILGLSSSHESTLRTPMSKADKGAQNGDKRALFLTKQGSFRHHTLLDPDKAAPARFEIFTGFTYKVYKRGVIYKPGEDRSKASLIKDLRVFLLPGVYVAFIQKASGSVVGEGYVEGSIRITPGGGIQVDLLGNVQPFSVLANMYVDISQFPDHLDVDAAQEDRKRKVKVLRSMDPFPAISQQDVHDILSAYGAGRGSFTVHSSEGVTSPVPAFRLLTISYIPPSHGEYLEPPDLFHDGVVSSFHIWMVMPSPEYPQWLPFAGYFTIYNQPWTEADPNPMGVQDGINMFPDVPAVCKRFLCLQARQNPYPQDANVPADTDSPRQDTGKGEQLLLEEGMKAEKKKATETSALGYSVNFSTVVDFGKAVDSREDEDDDEEEEEQVLAKQMQKARRRRQIQKRVVFTSAFAVLVIGAALLGYFLAPTTNVPAPTPKPVAVTPAPPPPKKPSYVDFVSHVKGTDVADWKDSVRSEYTARVASALKVAEGVVSISSITAAASQRRESDAAMRALLQTFGVLVDTRLLASSSEAASALYTSLQQPSSTAIIATSVEVGLASQGFKNATLSAVNIKALVLEGAPQYSPAPSTSPPPSLVQCGPYPVTANLTVAPGLYAAYPSRVTVLCKSGYRLDPGNYGSASPLCLFTGEFEPGRDCIGCGPGYFVTSQGGKCEECPFGTSSDAEAASKCVGCPPGRYADELGMQVCKACPTGMATLKVGGKTVADCKCLPGYFSLSGEANCLPCPTSTYSDLSEAQECRACPANSVTLATASNNQTACQCIVGHFATRASPHLECSKCPYGTYKWTIGNHECLRCPAASNTSLLGSIELDKCVCNPGYEPRWPLGAGVVDSNIVVTKNVQAFARILDRSEVPVESSLQQEDKEDTSIVIVPHHAESKHAVLEQRIEASFLDAHRQRRQYREYKRNTTVVTVTDSLRNTTVVTTIHRPNGGQPFLRRVTTVTSWWDVVNTTIITRNDTVVNHSGIHTCVACAKGEHTPGFIPSELDGSVCTMCPLGKYSSIPTSVCGNCVPGEAVTSDRQGCLTCPKGTFTAINEAPACISCPGGTYSETVRATRCFSCDPGYASSAGSTTCTLCQAGTAAPAASAVCAACPYGSTSNNRASSCTDCGQGFFTLTPSSTECSQCPQGTFANLARNSACGNCPPGSSSGRASSVCTLCPKGKYTSVYTSSACLDCAVGFFQDKVNSTYCMQCQPDSSSLGGAGSSRDCTCKQAGATQSSDGVCVPYWREGVQQGVKESTLENGGWQKCIESSYNTPLTKSSWETACQSKCRSVDRLLFGAKYTGNTTLEIAAMGSTRPVYQYNQQIAVQNPVFNGGVVINDGVARLHNGVYWYYTNFAFGFSAVPNIALTIIDKAAASCSSRLSWNIETSGKGYRAGCTCQCAEPGCEPNSCTNQQDLAGDAGALWQKVVWCSV